MMNEYYVYMIFDEIGKSRYVGASSARTYASPIRRWRNPCAWERDLPICRWLKEVGGPPIIRKVLTDLSHQDASYWVKNLITRLGRLCDKSGPLLNVTDGSVRRLG